MIVIVSRRKFLTWSRSSPYEFEGPVQGMAVIVEKVVTTKFSSMSFDNKLWKPPCLNCCQLLAMAGYPAYWNVLWENFKTFNGQLKGAQVFTKQFDREDVSRILVPTHMREFKVIDKL